MGGLGCLVTVRRGLTLELSRIRRRKGLGVTNQSDQPTNVGSNDGLGLEPERMGLDAIRQAIEERDSMEQQYHDLAEHMVYHGNSVSWWHSKATAYRNAIDEVWGALNAAGIRADGTKTCADGVRELAARLKA